jgi:hypothetical protein
MYKLRLFFAALVLTGCKANFNTQKYTHFKSSVSKKDQMSSVRIQTKNEKSFAGSEIVPPVATCESRYVPEQARTGLHPESLTCSADKFPVVRSLVSRSGAPGKSFELRKAKLWEHHKHGLLRWIIDTTLHIILFCLVVAAIVVLVIFLLI